MVGVKVKFYWYQIGSGDFLHAFFSTVAYLYLPNYEKEEIHKPYQRIKPMNTNSNNSNYFNQTVKTPNVQVFMQQYVIQFLAVIKIGVFRK